MKDKLLLLSFVSACLFASGWAFYLIGVHYDAVAGIEGGACGPEGGCQAVLQSGDAEIFGVPVSVPAVPLFAAERAAAVTLHGGSLPAVGVEYSRLGETDAFCPPSDQSTSQPPSARAPAVPRTPKPAPPASPLRLPRRPATRRALRSSRSRASLHG